MARKIKKKVSRKDLLKETDDFLTFSEQVTEWGRENWPLALIGTGLVAVVIVVVILVRSSIADSKARYQEQVADALGAFNLAMQSEAITPTTPSDVAFDTTKEYEDVAYKFEKLLRDYPRTQENPLILYYLGNSYQKTGKYDKARENYRKVIEMEGQGSLAGPARYNIGMSFYLEEKFDKALAIFRKLVDEKTPVSRAASLVYGGRCFEELGKFDEAIKYYQLALDAYSDSKLTKGLESHIEQLKIKSSEKGREGESPEPEPGDQ